MQKADATPVAHVRWKVSQHFQAAVLPSRVEKAASDGASVHHRVRTHSVQAGEGECGQHQQCQVASSHVDHGDPPARLDRWLPFVIVTVSSGPSDTTGQSLIFSTTPLGTMGCRDSLKGIRFHRLRCGNELCEPSLHADCAPKIFMFESEGKSKKADWSYLYLEADRQ